MIRLNDYHLLDDVFLLLLGAKLRYATIQPPPTIDRLPLIVFVNCQRTACKTHANRYIVGHLLVYLADKFGPRFLWGN